MKIQEKNKIKKEQSKFQIVSQDNVRSKFYQENCNMQNRNKSDIEINSPKINFNELKNNKDTVVIKNESSYLVLKSFLREHQVRPPSIFILYLAEIWRELSIYSSNYNNGILPFAFSRFFPLPGLINKRLFNVFDEDQDGYLSPKEFIKGLSIIYSEEICSLIEFIFLFYDFDYDGYITSEDIHAIMSYIPVIHSFNDMIDIEEEIEKTLGAIFLNKDSKINICEFTDLIINREVYEIFIPIISFFFEQKPFSNKQIYYFGKICINPEDHNKYLYQINNLIKLRVTKNKGKEEENKNKNHKIIFDFDRSKLKESTLENDITNFEKMESSTINNNKLLDESEKIRESNEKENLEDKIKTSFIYQKSSGFEFRHNSKTLRRTNRSYSIKENINKVKNNFMNIFDMDGIQSEEKIDKIDKERNDNINNKKTDQVIKRQKTTYFKNFKGFFTDSNGFRRLSKSIPSLINKTKILSKYSITQDKIIYSENKEKVDFYIRDSIIQNLCQSKIKGDKISEKSLSEDSFLGDKDKYNNNDLMGLKLVEKHDETNSSAKVETQNITYSSYLFKISTKSKKLKKLFFKLFNKDLYYMKSSSSKIYKGMHNLSHFFLELSQDYIQNNKTINKNKDTSISYEEDESYIDSASSITLENKSNSDKKIEEFKPIIKIINSKEYFCFILINQKGKEHWYLTPDKNIYMEWIERLKHVMNYQNIFDKYILKEVVGKGKFSTVYRAIDRNNERTVAIKIIDKRILKLNELDLLKTEIDILKICQHPYVIKLYEVIETYAHIDIVMEYCKISNLYQYLHNMNFELTEYQIVTYIHKIAKAVYSMQNLGIIHRDLKLSNIGLASEKEDIRILDFGLSKIIGPGETCSESYGTPGYAAPEVINEDNYGFKIDVWSIGAITYFMCTSKLPFDYVTKGLKIKNIIINTLNDEIKFKEECWKKYSKEVVQFIKGCMNKNPEKRLTIKEVLEHEWIKKYFFKEVSKRENIDMREYLSEYKSKNGSINKKLLDSSPKNNNFQEGIYRLYADISTEEGKK